MLRCLFLLIVVSAVFAQEIPPVYDFVVVVENSIGMAERKNAVISDVRDLIRANFAHQAEPGDRIHLWTCDLEDPGNTLQEWDPEVKDEIAGKAADYLNAVKFQRGNRLPNVLKHLGELAPHTRALIAVILTDGEEPLSGIGFDVEINQELSKLRRAASRMKRPVIIALSAIDGKWADWKASAGIARPRLPHLPVREKPVVEAEKSPAPPEPEFIPPPPPEPAPVFFYPPGTKILNTVAETIETPVAPAVTNEPPAAPVHAKAPIATEDVKTNETIIAAVAPAASTLPAPATNVIVPATNVVSQPVTQVLVQLNLPVLAVSNSPAATISKTAVSSHATQTPLLPYVAASAGGICLMVSALLLSKRGKPRPESLISKSIGR